MVDKSILVNRLFELFLIQPSLSLTKVNMAVAKLITPKVATALQTASVFVNSQIAKMHRTVHATKDNEITIKLIILTSFGFTIPLLFFFEPLSFCVMNNRLFELL